VTDPGRVVANPLEELTLDQLRMRTSIKWTNYPPDVLPLWVAELDVRLAPPIAEALRATIECGDTGYPSGDGYAEAVRDFAAARWAWQVAPERSMVVPDVMSGIAAVLRLVTAPRDGVVLCSPVYPSFFRAVTDAGRRVVEAPLDAAGRLDLAAVATAMEVAAKTSERPALLLCSPQNPTGAVHTGAELAEIAGLARRHGVRVVVDEIHAPLVLPGAEFVPYLSVPGTDDAVAFYSASKSWNLAGIKAALLVAGPEAAELLDRLPEVVLHGASHLGVIAHVAAFRHGQPWLDALLAGLDRNRTLVADLLAEHLPRVSMARPEATYFGWLDCRGLGLGVDPAELFLERGRVALSGGPPFGSGGAGFARLNCATSAANLREAVRRIAVAVS
jgi:cysteine-S-conjugate beta-lyase